MEPDYVEDSDSTFGGDRASLASSSTSLDSLVTDYTFEHGRRYHAYNAGKYPFPNDDMELNRMDIEHHNQKLQLSGRLHLCPLENPKEVLDIGTGSGIWCMEMADRYPSCQVVGTDLSPVQPDWIPPNCRFEVDDFEDVWTFGSNRFDMVHARFLLGSVSSYGELYAKAFDALSVGGWIEIVDMEASTHSDDNTLPADSALVQWGHFLSQACNLAGRSIPKTGDYSRLLRNAGFENVECRTVKRPINDWPKDPQMKEIGRFSCLNLLEGIEGFSMAPFTRVLGWPRADVEDLLDRARKELVNRKIHAWQKGVVCYGQKTRPSN